MGFCFHHLDLDQLERYLEERERRPEFVRHLVSCSRCSMRLAEERVLRALLAGLGRDEERDAGEHLGRDLLEGLLCEALAPGAAARVEEHLGRCDRCLAELLRVRARIGPVMGAGDRSLAVPEARADRVRRAFRGGVGKRLTGTLRGVFERLWGGGDLVWKPEVHREYDLPALGPSPDACFGLEEGLPVVAQEAAEAEETPSRPGAMAWRPVTFELEECRVRLSLEVAGEGEEGLVLAGRIEDPFGRLGGRPWEVRIVGHGAPRSFTGEEFRISLPSRVCELEFGPPLEWRIAVEIDPQPE